ncbi:pilin [Patescibacteria group bacterium]|nr:pilin [Patescibacteria group bacterium]
MRKLSKVFLQNHLKARLMLAILSCFFIAGFFVVNADSLVFNIAYAQGDNYGLDSGFQEVAIQSDRDIKQIIALIINIFLGFLGIIAVILILYAGYMWMTAGGNEEKVAQAKLILRNAVIGLVIVLSSWAIASFVISRLSDATGGGGVGTWCSSDPAPSCVPDNAKCALGLYCDGSCVCRFAGGGGGLGDNFEIKNFQTAHDGPTPDDDVYLCSSVGTIFNEMLIDPTVQNAWSDDTLEIRRIDDNGTAVDEKMSANMQTASNIIDISPTEAGLDNNQWPEYSKFEVHIPKTIEGISGRTLSNCLPPACNDRVAYYSWEFFTTDKDDVQDPYLVSTYPEITPENNNVNRKMTFSLVFSESIKTVSFLDGDTFKTGQTNIIVEEAASGAIIPSDQFFARVTDDGIYFSLKDTYVASYDGLLGHFDPYTRYKITVQGIKDLCNRDMTFQGPWFFTTNGVTAGVQGVYPPNGFNNTCPSSETFIQFRTSMYDITTDSCAVGNSLVQGGLGISERTAFNVALTGQEGGDFPVAGWDPENPNKYCRMYEFAPISNWLGIGTAYNPKVTYKISPDASPVTFNQADDEWEFTVVPEDQCAYPPYITSISPTKGAWGQCVTIRGRHFGTGPVADPPGAYSKLNLEEHSTNPAYRENRGVDVTDPAIITFWESGAGKDGIYWTSASNWTENYIVADVEDLKSTSQLHQDKDLDVDVRISSYIDLDDNGTKETELPSNTIQFLIDDLNYIGPCLYNIRPERGYWGDKVTLTGRDLGSGVDPDKVTFYNGLDLSASTILGDSGTWTSSEVRNIIVPEYAFQDPAGDQEVFITVNGVDSNWLDFDISAGKGDTCSSVPASCSPEPSICGSGLECRLPSEPEECTCQIPDRLIIRNPAPSACADSCTNAVISFEITKNINTTTADNTTIKLLQCADDNCVWADGTDVSITPTPASKRVEINHQLNINKWYRVAVLGGASGLKASDGKEIYNTNFDAGGTQAYSWKFRTGNSACGVYRIDMSPSGGILYENKSYEYTAVSYSRPNSCSSTGQQIAAVFNWAGKETTSDNGANDCENNSAHPKLGSMSPASSIAISTASVLALSVGAELPAWICAESSGVYGSAPVILKASCKSAADCTIGLCVADCVEGICQPKIYPAPGFSPQSGEIGTWMTITGCYFGNDWGQVKTGGTDALRPDEALCGNTWSNTQIIAETQSDGVVEVIRMGDGQSDDTNPAQFNITSDVWPAICRVTPAQERIGRVIEIKGQNFGLFSDFQTRTGSGTDNPSYGATYASPPQSDKTTDEVSESAGCASGGWGPDHICIRVVQGAPIGEGVVEVIRDNVSSAGYYFKVIDISTRPQDAEDLYVASYTPGEGNLACLNMIIEVGLVNKLDVDSLDSSKFYVQESGGAIIEGTIQAEIGRNSKLRFIPSAPLTTSTNYKIILKGGTGGLRSLSGGIIVESGVCSLTGGDCEIAFNTVDNAGDDMCKISHLEIAPNSPVFTCAHDNCDKDIDFTMTGRQTKFSAVPINFYNQPALSNSDILWSSSNVDIIADSYNSGQNPLPWANFRVMPKDGSSIIRAYSEDANVSGSTEARVFLCENPWPTGMDVDGEPFQDRIGYDTSENPKTNFSTFYCRDKGESGTADDLPEISKSAEFGLTTPGRSVPGLLKEVFFTQPYSKTCIESDETEKIGISCSSSTDCDPGGVCIGEIDAIGIRVLKNPNNLSVSEWYNSQDFEKGSPKSVQIDKFDALQDGRTIYVSAINDTDITPGTASIYNNIYLISINDKAHPDTIEIYNQLVENWRFLVNIIDNDDKEKLRRDLQRVDDAYYMASVIENKGYAVKLESGTRMKGHSVSVWPSWDQALVQDFGASFPKDPVNKVYCSDLLQPTCWNGSNLVCNGNFPDGSKSTYYRYKYVEGIQKQAILQFNLEYSTSADWANVFVGPGWTPGTNACVNMEYIKIY